jgi:hypothetical protein
MSSVFLGGRATHPAFSVFISPMLANSTGTILCNLRATSIGKQKGASVGKGAFELHF